MANLHPSVPVFSTLGAGSYRERDVLRVLEEGLPQGFDIFHNVDWSVSLNGVQQIGEVDIAIVSPTGHLLLTEVKAGKVEEGVSGLYKHYAGSQQGLDIGRQLRKQHSAILSRLQNEGIAGIHVGTLLVLPDYRVTSVPVALPRECIVDATEMDFLSLRVKQCLPLHPVPADMRRRLLDFLGNRFSVVPDVASHIGQLQRSSTALSSGLATWVPTIRHKSELYVIEATAGSGKTQLALALLRHAHVSRQRCAYVCYNRPLADHMATIAPVSAEVMTFHEACVEWSRSIGQEPDFTKPEIYQELEASFLQGAVGARPRWDLLILDETQDLKPEWVQALLSSLKDGGKGYLMGDPQQQVYARDGFDLQDSVTISCMDNFRSPRRVVDAINLLGITREPVVARSFYAGETPGFHTYAPGRVNAVAAVQDCLRRVVASGVKPEHIAVLSFSGRDNSEVLAEKSLADLPCKKPTGLYDMAGNALWTDGVLLTDTVYRFKGQSAPVVLLCEIDFETLAEKELRKLFVGLTRAQYQIECILSDRAANMLLARAG